MKTIALLAAACALATAPAFAASMGEKTGINKMLDIAPKTADFFAEAAQSDMFEIASSKLAATKTQGDVAAFATQMVSDHTKTSSEIMPLAQKERVQLPPDMSSSQKSMLDKLQTLNGKDFDKQYADDQVSVHKDAVSLFERYGKGGRDKEAAAWASQTLPTLQHHLEMAQQLNH